ncbi:MAG: hypothetical protein LBS27_06190 [Bifidobacteriaceae bacterium]|jgi:hypothetical protein|nr:hypothetical protein [Bifidobacteriaceae bacterium]
MTTKSTLIRVPVPVRDHARALAGPGQTQGDVIAQALDLLEQELFWKKVAAVRPDPEYFAEFAEWDAAPLQTGDDDE